MVPSTAMWGLRGGGVAHGCCLGPLVRCGRANGARSPVAERVLLIGSCTAPCAAIMQLYEISILLILGPTQRPM